MSAARSSNASTVTLSASTAVKPTADIARPPALSHSHSVAEIAGATRTAAPSHPPQRSVHPPLPGVRAASSAMPSSGAGVQRATCAANARTGGGAVAHTPPSAGRRLSGAAAGTSISLGGPGANRHPAPAHTATSTTAARFLKGRTGGAAGSTASQSKEVSPPRAPSPTLSVESHLSTVSRSSVYSRRTIAAPAAPPTNHRAPLGATARGHTTASGSSGSRMLSATLRAGTGLGGGGVGLARMQASRAAAAAGHSNPAKPQAAGKPSARPGTAAPATGSRSVSKPSVLMEGAPGQPATALSATIPPPLPTTASVVGLPDQHYRTSAATALGEMETTQVTVQAVSAATESTSEAEEGWDEPVTARKNEDPDSASIAATRGGDGSGACKQVASPVSSRSSASATTVSTTNKASAVPGSTSHATPTNQPRAAISDAVATWDAETSACGVGKGGPSVRNHAGGDADAEQPSLSWPPRRLPSLPAVDTSAASGLPVTLSRRGEAALPAAAAPTPPDSPTTPRTTPNVFTTMMFGRSIASNHSPTPAPFPPAPPPLSPATAVDACAAPASDVSSACASPPLPTLAGAQHARAPPAHLGALLLRGVAASTATAEISHAAVTAAVSRIARSPVAVLSRAAGQPTLLPPALGISEPEATHLLIRDLVSECIVGPALRLGAHRAVHRACHALLHYILAGVAPGVSDSGTVTANSPRTCPPLSARGGGASPGISAYPLPLRALAGASVQKFVNGARPHERHLQVVPLPGTSLASHAGVNVGPDTDGTPVVVRRLGDPPPFRGPLLACCPCCAVACPCCCPPVTVSSERETAAPGDPAGTPVLLPRRTAAARPFSPVATAPWGHGAAYTPTAVDALWGAGAALLWSDSEAAPFPVPSPRGLSAAPTELVSPACGLLVGGALATAGGAGGGPSSALLTPRHVSGATSAVAPNGLCFIYGSDLATATMASLATGMGSPAIGRLPFGTPVRGTPGCLGSGSGGSSGIALLGATPPLSARGSRPASHVLDQAAATAVVTTAAAVTLASPPHTGGPPAVVPSPIRSPLDSFCASPPGPALATFVSTLHSRIDRLAVALQQRCIPLPCVACVLCGGLAVLGRTRALQRASDVALRSSLVVVGAPLPSAVPNDLLPAERAPALYPPSAFGADGAPTMAALAQQPAAAPPPDPAAPARVLDMLCPSPAAAAQWADMLDCWAALASEHGLPTATSGWRGGGGRAWNCGEVVVRGAGFPDAPAPVQALRRYMREQGSPGAAGW